MVKVMRKTRFLRAVHTIVVPTIGCNKVVTAFCDKRLCVIIYMS